MGKLVESEMEGGSVFVWRRYLNQFATNEPGHLRYNAVVISFKTYAAFVDDTGIEDPKIRAFGPVVSTNRGSIHVYDVQIVG